MAIYRVSFSEKDSSSLAGRSVPCVLEKNKVDFMQWVVNKPWGYEYMMCSNSFSEVWILFIKEDAVTSMHSHPNKRTSLVVLKGEVFFSTFNTSITLKAMDAVLIDAGVFHSTRAVSPGGAYVMETESDPRLILRLVPEKYPETISSGKAGTVIYLPPVSPALRYVAHAKLTIEGEPVQNAVGDIKKMLVAPDIADRVA